MAPVSEATTGNTSAVRRLKMSSHFFVIVKLVNRGKFSKIIFVALLRSKLTPTNLTRLLLSGIPMSEKRMLMAAFNLVLLGTDDVKILDLLTGYLTATFIVSFEWLLKIGFAPLPTPAMTYSKC